MKCMPPVEQGDQQIDIKQAAHKSDTFFVHEATDMFRGDDFSVGRNNWHSVATLQVFGHGRCLQRLASQSRQHFPGGDPLAGSQLFGSLKDVILNIESGSYTSDAISSDELSQFPHC
jgi:hypothetical protein